jgi:hypothetical protein
MPYVHAAPRPMRRVNHPTREALIRTLGVSLVAVAAIVASLTLVRQSQQLPAQPRDKRPEHSPAAVDLDLEQLRAAGF